MYTIEPDFKRTAETLSPNIQLLSSVLKVKPSNVRPSPHVYRPVNQVPTTIYRLNVRMYIAKPSIYKLSGWGCLYFHATYLKILIVWSCLYVRHFYFEVGIIVI
jgi:hypothetical protein